MTLHPRQLSMDAEAFREAYVPACAILPGPTPFWVTCTTRVALARFVDTVAGPDTFFLVKKRRPL